MKETSYATEKPLQRAGVCHVEMPSEFGELILRQPQAKLDEAINLAEALQGVEIVGSQMMQLNKINPKLLIGGGKAEELEAWCAAEDLDVLIINTKLSPTQQRNLELAVDCKVIDRTGLILEIFAERARTKAGRLQVELAQLSYEASRLVNSWTHLERQRGGMGKTGGPGERQIELDRRMNRDRITSIKRELQQVEKERNLHRRARNRAGTPVVALVGYTNAGKSTLFNALVGADALAKDMLFATLDPLMRKLELPSGREVILSDTVGFVSDLPHELVEAFKATLEEVVSADILLHVHDASSEDALAQAQDVRDVLTSINAHDIPSIHVFNKIDLIEGTTAIAADEEDPFEHLTQNPSDLSAVSEDGLRTSAVTGEGIDLVITTIDDELARELQEMEYDIDISDGKRIAWLHAHGEVLSQELNEEQTSYKIKVRLHEADLGAFRLI